MVGGGDAGEDAHTTWLVLLIKDGRGPAGNYPLISTPLLCAMLTLGWLDSRHHTG